MFMIMIITKIIITYLSININNNNIIITKNIVITKQ